MTSQMRLARLRGWAFCAAVGSLLPRASAIITFGSATNNTTTPPGSIGNYEVEFGSFLGTIISSNVMVTATHIGSNTTGSVTIGVTPYNLQLATTIDDLAIWQIAPNGSASFPTSSIAPVYTGSSEVGLSVVDVGRGVQRGTDISGSGWNWGAATGDISWGSNTVAAIDTDKQLGETSNFGGDFLQYDFDNNPADTNEGIIASGDSGGGLFVDVNGVYELAGVNSLVDTVLDSSGNALQAALYDEQGYYYKNAANQLTQITTDTPESSFATRISSKMNLVGVVTGNIPPSAAAANPVSNDGAVAIYTSMTTGAFTGGTVLSIGNPFASTAPATLQIAPNSGGSALDSLSIATGCSLDITNTHVIISYASAANATTILQYLASGYNGGLWNGTGIISSTAASGSGRYGVGFASGTVGGVSGLTSGQVEIAYALYGDANLDGTVNGTDFGLFAANFGKVVSGGWQMGDFDYNGVVNGADFGRLAGNFGMSASGTSVVLPEGDWAALDAFAEANGLSLTAVPEPVCTGLLGVVGLGLLARRRRDP
jgi:hypothetical protein